MSPYYDPSPSDNSKDSEARESGSRDNPLPQLRTTQISRSSAIQRAGRAGRIPPGRYCIRLYDETTEFEGRFTENVTVELDVVELSGVVLSLVEWSDMIPVEDGVGSGGGVVVDGGGGVSVGDVKGHLDWVDQPEEVGLERGIELLVGLGALLETTSD